MNVANLYDVSDIGRKLYQEIAMIEEEHVSQYESLIDSGATWLESLLLHEYTECYLYYSCLMTECDPYIRRIWEECLVQEIAHLHKAAELLQRYEHKDYCQVVGEGTFPSILELRPNIDYVRRVLETTVGNTQKKEFVVPLSNLSANDPFFRYQRTVNPSEEIVPSHIIVDEHICHEGEDYRYEVEPNPVDLLQSRCCDNTSLGRIPRQTPERHSVCGTTRDACRCGLTDICE